MLVKHHFKKSVAFSYALEDSEKGYFLRWPFICRSDGKAWIRFTEKCDSNALGFFPLLKQVHAWIHMLTVAESYFESDDFRGDVILRLFYPFSPRGVYS